MGQAPHDRQHLASESHNNKGYCDSCKRLVSAVHVEEGGKVYFVKTCPQCGETRDLLSGDARRYDIKRELDGGYNYTGCAVNCLDCPKHKKPTFVFLDVTNRCNLNCPICINNTPSMGFTFDPPIEYFENVFKELSAFPVRPAVQLFGGEPTVRKDLFDIIKMCQSYGLAARVVTNGVKLADREYCKRLVESKATILIAYDGANPNTYSLLRQAGSSLPLKQKAIENLVELGAKKVGLMTCIGKGINDNELPDLIRFCHDRRNTIRGINFMPLVHTWDPAKLDLNPERMTSEDIEQTLKNCFPGLETDFVPAGVFGRIPHLVKSLKIKPPPFAGAHPNCESFYLLVSNGEEYVPFEWYLKSSLPAMMKDLIATEERHAARVRKLDVSVGGKLLAAIRLKGAWSWLMGGTSFLKVARRNLSFGRFFKGKGLAKVWHGLCALTGLIVGRRTASVLARHTRFQQQLQLIVLPFEDLSVLETERLERCPNAFVFWDPKDERLKHVPVCAWNLHKRKVMRAIAEHYAAQPATTA